MVNDLMTISANYMSCVLTATIFNISATSSHFHFLQVENCDNTSRLVVDEDSEGHSSMKGLSVWCLLGNHCVFPINRA